jgi:hypothetical protein
MDQHTRREFLGQVGRGMLWAGLGSTLAGDLGIAPAFANDADAARLDFGSLEPLVALMQETPPAQLTQKLVEKIKSGTDLKTLTAAGALANARTFGGEDYVGFHTFMALAPAYRIAQGLPLEQQPLPVLKVLYRNANRIQEFGGRQAEVLHAVQPSPLSAGAHPGEALRDASRSADVDAAEGIFANLAQGPLGEAFNHLQFAVEDEIEVHRVVLCWRAWDTLDLAGQEWAHCLLRQSVRYCAQTERRMNERNQARSTFRTLLPALLDQYKLVGRQLGTNPGDDQWLEELAVTLFRGNREQATDAVAQAIQEGYAPDSIAQALSLAANMLALHDPGRLERWATPEKPAGSCHGDSVGVHASDAANAWRHIVAVSDQRNIVASLLAGAFNTAGQSEHSNAQPYPLAEQLAAVRAEKQVDLLQEAEEAIRAGDQFRAAAIIARYGQLGHAAPPVFDLMRQFATSEDGALHAEKYFNTVCEEYATLRPAHRWNQLVALARVTASEFGRPAPGYVQAKELLGV